SNPAARVETTGIEPVRWISAVGGGDVMISQAIRHPAVRSSVPISSTISAAIVAVGAAAAIVGSVAAHRRRTSIGLHTIKTDPGLSLGGQQPCWQGCSQREKESHSKHHDSP